MQELSSRGRSQLLRPRMWGRAVTTIESLRYKGVCLLGVQGHTGTACNPMPPTPENHPKHKGDFQQLCRLR
jgi:hypothetical protein